MVKDAPGIREALESFFAFIGKNDPDKPEKLLIAHNANFDTGFMRIAAAKEGLPFAYPFVDTVPMSRFLNPV